MPFPTTSLLDDFNRANEFLGDGPNWDYGVFDEQAGPTLGLRIVSNVIENANVNSSAYWNTSYAADQEVYADVVTINNDYMGVYARIQTADVSDGYGFYKAGNSNGEIYVCDNGAFTLLASGAAAWSSGDKLGADCVGSALTLYRHNGSSWSSVCTVSDGTWTGGGYIGLYLNAINGDERADNFSGGDVADASHGALLLLGVG